MTIVIGMQGRRRSMGNVQISRDKIITSKQMLLRHPKLSDAVEIFSVVSSPKFPEQLPLKEMDSLDKIETWLKRLIELWDEGGVYSWIMEKQVTNQLLGQVTLSKIEGDHRWALAFWTHPDHWGKGHATEGAERILKFGFEELGAKTIWAAAGTWNVGSNRVLEKLGMKYIGDNPKGYFSKGEPIPTHEYEISRENWETLIIAD
jgi:ribosomal-protein-alanine N-acetyltransferase